MIRVSASAPGKIVLCGEYAVLDGAPSICFAVNKRAIVSIQQNGKAEHTVRCPGFAGGSFRFSCSADGGFNWHADGEHLPDFSLLEYAWSAQSRAPSSSLDLVLDTGEFIDSSTGSKYGLGGSAALMVALVAALARLHDAAGELDGMINTHRRFQDGYGSGVDVATAFTGGVLAYRRGEPASVQAMRWRSDLEYVVLWSGRSVSTMQKLSRLAASDADNRSRVELGRASGKIVDAWQDADAKNIVALFHQYNEALAAFDDDHQLGIFDAGHAELVDLALSTGVVYKPCGAGGGDIGIALSAAKGAIDQFRTAAADRGFMPLDVCMDKNGLNVGNI